jgi:hypothetical protein
LVAAVNAWTEFTTAEALIPRAAISAAVGFSVNPLTELESWVTEDSTALLSVGKSLFAEAASVFACVSIVVS